MTVQIVENWSEISGIVGDFKPSAKVKGFHVVVVIVEQVEMVDGFKNLLEGMAGSDLQVHVPDYLVKDLDITRGDRITCWVRQAGPNRFFVHREHIIIQHS